MEEPLLKMLKSFGLLMGGIFILITLVMVYHDFETLPFISGALSLGFIVTALAFPRKLRNVHEQWMKFAEVIGRFNAKLIIGFIYMVFFSFMRFIFWAIRKDPMNRKFDLSAKSYWQKHETFNNADPNRYEKQF